MLVVPSSQDNRQILRNNHNGADINKPECELFQGYAVTFRRTDHGNGIIADLRHEIMVKRVRAV